MDASSLFSSANVFYVNEEYEEALKHYTCAVTLQEDCAEFRSCRAAAFLKLGQFAAALDDAEHAVKCDPKCYTGFYRKGIALFYLGDYRGAQLAFQESLRLSPNASAPRSLWLRKCNAELSGSTLPLGGVAAEASRGTTAAAAAYPASASAATPAPAPAPPAPTATSTKASSSSAAETAGDVSISGRKQIRREWYQSDTHVFISIFAKDVPEKDCRVEYNGESSISVLFPLPGGVDEEYQLDLDLFDSIDASACTVEVSKVKVEVKLAKKTLNNRWGDLERKEEEVFVEAADHPKYPTSSKAKRDWSNIDKECEAMLTDEKPEGDAALNKLFQDIYERADPETRRAMNKSFQTSGGTVLSTNWGEVGKADYEGKDRPTPPEGQVWKDTRTDKK